MATSDTRPKRGGGQKALGHRAEHARRQGELRAKALAEISTSCHEHRRPLTITGLADRVGAPPGELLKILGQMQRGGEVLLVKSQLDSIVVPRDALELLADSDVLLEFAAAAVRAKRTRGGKNLQSPPKKFCTDASLPKDLRTRFERALTERIERCSLPAEVAELIVLPPTPAELAAKKAAAEAEKAAKKAAAAAEKAAKQAALERAKAEIPAKLIAIIRSQLNASPDSYPVSEARLVELAELGFAKKAIQAAFRHPSFLDSVSKCSLGPANSASGKATAAYFLKSDLDTPPPKLIARAASAAIAAKTLAAKKTNVVTIREIAGVLASAKDAKARLAKAIDAAADRGGLPAEIAWLWSQGARLFFRAVDAEPHGLRRDEEHAPPGRRTAEEKAPTGHPVQGRSDFAAAFDAAFAQVAARTGKRHFLKLADLRAALPQYSTDEFNAGLRELRLADRYTLDSAQGGAFRLTEDESQAGIQEGGSLLVYVSRK